MTIDSINALSLFLEKHQQFFFDEMRIADFGGTEKIGDNIIKNILAAGDLKNYHMLDFDNGIDLREPIVGEKFDLGICMDLLEHVSNPFLVSKNIIDSLKPGAFLFVTVPFVWELHAVPDDFWRFTPSGIMELFKDMEMELVHMMSDSSPLSGYNQSLFPVSAPFSRVIGYFRKLEDNK